MQPNPVKRALQAGGIALGTMVFEFNTPGIARVIAAAGGEFVVFDMEHTGWSIETLRQLIPAAGGTDVVPMGRVPATEYHFLARALDVGARGLMVPMVETEEQARRIVAATKYPPQGRRGAAFGVAHDDYRDGDLVEKMTSANDETLLIAQIETAQGVENVDRIAAVEGIDVLWIGHFDLTNSLGIPGQFNHPDYRGAVDAVLAACGLSGKAAGFMVASPEEGRQALAAGFRCLAYWGDVWLYRRALAEGLTSIRGA